MEIHDREGAPERTLVRDQGGRGRLLGVVFRLCGFQ
jgi:hypothetical protein